MIKSVKLTNFFSFKDDEIDLDSRVNLLVGINGSGKSNFLKAFQLLKTGVEGNQDDNALFKLLVEEWGGFENIYSSSETKGEHGNSIGLEFCFDGRALSTFGAFNFREDVVYKIEIIRQAGGSGYHVSESIRAKKEGGFIYLDFIHGAGKLSERSVPENGSASQSSERSIRWVNYEGYNPQELVLSKISALDKDQYLPLTIIKEAVKSIMVYNFFDTTPGSKMRRAASPTVLKQLLPDGSNLPQLLNRLNLLHKPEFRKAQQILKDANPNFSGFDFNILGGGFIELYLDENGLKRSVHVAHVSDGTLRFLCLLAILFNPERGRFICIDEPEIGLHPDMIFNITSKIKEASDHTTFLISTHSPSILNAFKLDQIRVFEKNDANETETFTYSEEDFEGWYEEFNPGAMWRAGDIGGKRW